MSHARRLLLKTSAVLWILWGLVHAFAGVMTIVQDPSSGFAMIADATDPALFAQTYPSAVAGVLNQHGWNLLWFGLVTLIGAMFIWRGNRTAIWVTALVGGLADLGYFLFLDLPGHVHFLPGTVMTLISGSAIVVSAWVGYSERPISAPGQRAL